MPIYFCVIEYINRPEFSMMPTKRMLKIIECDISDTDRLWRELVAPLVNCGMKVQAEYFERTVPVTSIPTTKMPAIL